MKRAVVKGFIPNFIRELSAYPLFLLLTNKRTTKNTITIPDTRATRINTVPGFAPFDGVVVVAVAVATTLPVGLSLGMGRVTAGLGGGAPSGL